MKYKASQEEEVFKATREDEVKSSMVRVINKKNQPMEIYLGRNILRWESNGEKFMSEQEISHPDFQSMSRYFTVIK